MEKDELEALVAKALKEHPEVFPGSPQIAELLKKNGIKIYAVTISKNFNLPDYQLKWIKSCPEKILLDGMGKRIFNQMDIRCKEVLNERLKKIVETELEKNPEVFPGVYGIMELLKTTYKVDVGEKPIFKTLDFPALQLKWLKSCPKRAFLENLSRGSFSSLDENCQEARKKRFESIVETELEKNPEVFPGSNQIVELLKMSYEVTVSPTLILTKFDLHPLQINWINSCPEKIFLESASKRTFGGGLNEKCKEAVKERFREIIKLNLKNNPGVFPSGRQIADLLKKYGVKLGPNTVRANIDLPAFQLDWVNSCPDIIFFKNFSKNIFKRADEKCKKAVKKRLKKIVEAKLKENPDVFPTPAGISKLLKKIGPAPIVRNIDTMSFQLAWIKNSKESVFLEKLSKNALVHLKEKCRQAVDEKMHDIFLSRIDNLHNLPISRSTLHTYLKKFPDAAFLLAATQEHKHTVDQRIILAMHLLKETRSEDLHELIGERLEQLWGFRELFALMKDGRCLDADIISMFHESLPERIGNYIPESTVTHSFVDNLRLGDFKAGKEKDVLLLSFMHWLTDKQSAEIMLRLNQSVGTDNAIYMTSPNGLEYAEDIIASMNSFGFVPEKVGSLYLLPPGESGQDEQRKLLTKGKVLQFRKIQDVDRTPEELQLFSKEKKKKGGVRLDPKADIISYNEKTLKNSLPLITMKDVDVIFTEEVPEVRKVEVEDERAILTLKGGALLGFNVEPEHPYSIEVEGRKIPKGTDNAVLDITNGKEGFEVRKGLKTKYKDFMKLIRGKRKQISAVKKTKLKRK